MAILTCPVRAFETLSVHPAADRDAVEFPDVFRLLTYLAFVPQIVSQIRPEQREATGTLGIRLYGALMLPRVQLALYEMIIRQNLFADPYTSVLGCFVAACDWLFLATWQTNACRINCFQSIPRLLIVGVEIF